ncbi:hypothetical protein R1sor_027044 [Riccia sorocarpa]|uniref:Uncharacterized protein n=1 Tax=Riccia sorocarpa TaxID=122646 RepID=A0ABD3GGT0_9MARC
MWNFFCSGHGKGEHDGQGAVVKSQLLHLQMLHGVGHFDRAEDIVSYCRGNLTTGSTDQIKRVFWEVKETDVDRSPTLQAGTLPGCKQLHYFWGNSRMDPTLLRTREFTCMCLDCLESQFEACELQEWVTEWDFRSLVLSPTGVQSMHDITLADEFHVGADHEVLSDTLAVGDVFAVKGSSDEEETEYWLLRCTGTKQKITEKEILMAISEVEAPSFERL